MKKFLISLILFALFFLLTSVVLETIFKLITPKKDRYAWQYQELFNPKVNGDLVIFGSSKSARGINSKLLETENISVFNFGLNGSNPKFTYYWYNNLFKKYYPKPKLILMEISWMMLDTSRMWRIVEQDARYLPVKDYFSLLMETESKEAAFFNRFHVFNRTVGSGGAMDLTYNGYTPNLKISKPKSIIDSLKYKPSESQLFYFDLLLKSFQEDNITALFVILPENLSHNFIENPIVNKSLITIKEKSAAYNFDVLDYHNYFETDSLFGDWGHLNFYGADSITKKIKDDIKARSGLNVYSN